jgi:hypothetical protein
MRRTATAVLMVSALFLLSGCFTMKMDLTVNDDQTVDGTMVMALDEEMFAMMGDGEESELFDDDDLPEGAEVEDYEQDGRKGKKVTFSDVKLSEFSESMADGDSDFKIEHDGDEYVFTATMDPGQMTGESGESTGDAEFDEQMQQMMERMFEDAEVNIALTFPGDVTDSNGKVDGNRVSWDVDLTEPAELRAVAADTSGFPVLAVVMAALAAVLLAAGGWFLFLRKPKDSEPEEPVATPVG